jgi:hypothetical protein
MHDAVTTSATGIPIEYLFTIIGSLLMLIYLDVKRDLRKLRSNAHKRDLTLARLSTALRFVCRKLNIPFPSDDSENDSDQE